MSIPKNRPPSVTPGPSHYFDPRPVARSRPRSVFLHLGELALELQADRGVFGSRAVDLGTLALLREAPAPPPDGDILDLGSGYGPIAIALAKQAPKARVWAVDVNERALELTRANARAAGAMNVTAGLPDEVPLDIRFGALCSNSGWRGWRRADPPIWWCSATSAPILWRRGWPRRVMRCSASSPRRATG